MTPSNAPPHDDAVALPTALAARRMVLTFMLATLVGLVGIAGLNVLADPFGAFGVELIPADSRAGDSRTARAELLRRFTGETVLIGSSRTRVGYDGGLPCTPGGAACNVGLDGTHLRELVLVVEQAVANPHVERIVLSLDLHLSAAEWQPNADFRCSRFNPDRSSLEHTCDLLWNGRTIEASSRVIRNALRGRPAQHDKLGFARGAAIKFEQASQTVRSAAALTQLCGAEGLLGNPQPREQTRQQLAAMFALCQDHSIELTVVIDPVHALLLEGIRQRGDWDGYCTWKRDLVELASRHGATVWDFTGYTPWTTEPLLGDDVPTSRWFWEPSHMRRELGDKVLARVFGDSTADPRFGVRLTSPRLAEHWAIVERDRQDWLRTGSVEVHALAYLLAEPDAGNGQQWAADPPQAFVR